MKKLLFSAAAAAVIATGAMAANPAIATDGTGDMLIAPAFFTTGGYSTTLKVVNTNQNDSVLMRVVVRDAYCSREVDFPILLSPGDAWNATIASDAKGNSVITSTDDSTYPGLGLDKGVALASVNTLAEGKFAAGYVEFLPIAQYADGGQKMDKASTLKARFDALAAASATPTGANVVDNGSVTGTVTLTNSTLGTAMTLPMTAIEGANDAVVFGAAMALGKDTIMSNFLGTVNETALLTALRKSSIAVPFSDAGANSVVNFLNWDDHTCSVNPQTRVFNVSPYDMSENKPSPIAPQFSGSPVPTQGAVTVVNELGQTTVTAMLSNRSVSYTDGWLSISPYRNYANTNPTTQTVGTNAAVIPTYMTAVKVGSGFTTNWMYLPYAK